MSAVILCDFPADESAKTLILENIVLLATEGSGELLFAGRHQSATASDRELIAVKLNSLKRADAIVRTWRLSGSIPSTVDLKVIKLEPMRLFDNPLMLFP